MKQEATIQEVENGFIVRTFRGNDSPMTISDSRERVKVFSSWLEVFTELGIFFSAGLVSKNAKSYDEQCEKEDRGPCQTIRRGF